MSAAADLPPEGGPARDRDVTPWVPPLGAPVEALPADATDAELLNAVEAMHRTRAELDLHRAQVLAALWAKPRSDSRDQEQVLREVAIICGISMAAAERLVTASAVLAMGLEATKAELLDGVIPWTHVEVIALGSLEVPAKDRDRFEREAVRLASGAGVGQAKDRVRQLIDRINPADMVERHEREMTERDVTIQPGPNGMAWLNAYLPAVEAVAIYDRLTRAAVALHGEQGEDRCIGQLRADVFIDLALNPLPEVTDWDLDCRRRNWGAMDIVPQVHVTVPVLTLLVESDQPGFLRGYGPIDPVTARRLTANAPSLYRLLTDPGSDTVVQVSREHYEVPVQLKRFLQIRDQRCRFPGCNRNAHLCDIDHTIPWVWDGETNAKNLACLCRKHHQLKERGWSVWQDDDGAMHWTSPYGRKRTTLPAVALAA